MEGLDPSKIAPALAGPVGAFVALLLFIVYLMREVKVARTEKDRYMGRYEDMRTQRDEFRFLAGDALRAGKRAAQTAVALGSDDGERERQPRHARARGPVEDNGEGDT